MLPSSRLIAASLLAASSATAIDVTAHAEPLDGEVCKVLKAERQTLLTPQVKAALARGPDWVKDHLHSTEQIEQVRKYLQVEAKVAFRCRTDGVVMPKPPPMERPDRKPPVPIVQVAASSPGQILAGAAATSLLPVRKPSLSSAENEAEASPAADTEEPQDSADAGAPPDPVEVTTSIKADPAPSQTVADSDKTAPSQRKATQ